MTHRRLRLLLLCLALSPSPAVLAETRLDARSSTCAGLRDAMRKAGSAVVTTQPFVYDLYVASPSGCPGNRRPVPATAPTRDSPACGFGFSCAPTERM